AAVVMRLSGRAGCARDVVAVRLLAILAASPLAAVVSALFGGAAVAVNLGTWRGSGAQVLVGRHAVGVRVGRRIRGGVGIGLVAHTAVVAHGTSFTGAAGDERSDENERREDVRTGHGDTPPT